MAVALLANGKRWPLMGLGTWQIRTPTETNRAIDCALAAGYRLFDTAQRYKNEDVIGEALERLLPKHGLTRKDVCITTKLEPRDGELVEAAVRQQLGYLRTDYVDMLLIHAPAPFADPTNPENPRRRRETWLALERLRDAGLCEGIGVANYEIRHLDELAAYAASAPLVNQCEFHPHFTRRPLLNHCRRVGVHLQAFTSLGRLDPLLMTEATLADVARAHSVSVAQVLLAFAVRQGISVIPKTMEEERIRENFEAADVELTNEQLDSIARLNRDRPLTACAPWLMN